MGGDIFNKIYRVVLAAAVSTNAHVSCSDASMQGAAFDAMETGGVESCVGGLSQDQLMQLKREAVACINETLLKRLEEMEKVR